MEERVSLVTLGVKDLARARAFYSALGWKPAFDDGDVVFYQAGGMVLALWGGRSSPPTARLRTAADGAE